MTPLSLSFPAAGNIVTAGLHSANYGQIQTVVNGGIDNTNIAPAAAIAYSKLNLTGLVTNADIAAAAGIAISKLAGYPADAGKFLNGNGAWAVPIHPGAQIQYDAITTAVTVSATTEGTANTVIAGSSATYDGTDVYAEFSLPKVDNGVSSNVLTLVLLMDATVIGHYGGSAVERGGFWKSRTLTPGAGAHTFTLKAYVDTGSYSVGGGAGGAGNYDAAWLRVVSKS